jgi:hypothetical protein
MAEADGEKSRIIAELAGTRFEINTHLAHARVDLDVKKRVSDSIRQHSYGWMTIAAIFGWLLSRIPARKKKIYIHASSTTAKVVKKEASRAGWALLAWNAAWSIGKPLLTAYLARRMERKI